jgi:hypothetical protein
MLLHSRLMTEPTFDADGYPTEETLEFIATHTEIAEVLDFVKAAWHWPTFATHGLREAEAALLHMDLADPEMKYLRLATGGWSGNESLVAAMERNRLLGVLCWQLSARGGLHIYAYPRS